MRIERGCFERASHRRIPVARVRVVVDPADFERLELREFERADRLSPCIAVVSRACRCRLPALGNGGQ